MQPIQKGIPIHPKRLLLSNKDAHLAHIVGIARWWVDNYVQWKVNLGENKGLRSLKEGLVESSCQNNEVEVG